MIRYSTVFIMMCASPDDPASAGAGETSLAPAGDGHARRRAERRDQIIAAAARVFFEKGFSRTSMDDVLGAVGGSKRTLYQHFPSKEDLFTAVIAGASDRTLAALGPKPVGDLRQTLFDIGTRYLGMLVSHDGLAGYRAMISEAPHLPDLARTFFETGPRRVSGALADVFVAHNRGGGARIAHPVEAADQFIGMMRGDLHLAALTRNEIPSRDQVARVVASAVRTLLGGIMDAPPPEEGVGPAGRHPGD